MTIKLNDINKLLKLVKVLSGHTGYIFRIGWSNSGNFLASSSSDKTVKIWDILKGVEVNTLVGHEGEVNTVQWSPDDTFIASASDDFKVKIWDASSGKNVKTMSYHTDEVNDLAWSPDGSKIASVSDDKYIVVVNSKSGSLIEKIRIHSQAIWSIEWSPSGLWIATGSDDQTIRLVNIETNEKRILRGHKSTVRSICWCPDESYLISGDRNGKLIIWNIDFPDNIRVLEGHSSLITSVTVSRDGSLIGTKSKDDTIRIWDFKTGNTIGVIHEKGSNRWSNGIKFSPSQNILATLGENDQTIRLWEYDIVENEVSVEEKSDFSNDIFISYSHQDSKWFNMLLQMITPLTRTSNINIWSDKEINSGDNWKQKIENEIARCNWAILLVSPAFLASSFINEVELPSLLDKDKVIWIPVKHSLFEEVGLDKLQAAWPPNTPLNGMSPDEQEFQLAKLSRELKEMLLK